MGVPEREQSLLIFMAGCIFRKDKRELIDNYEEIWDILEKRS